MKKVLFIFPENFLRNKQGNHAYALNIIKILKRKNFNIDFFCVDVFNDVPNDFYELNKKFNNLIDNLYCYKHYENTENIKENKKIFFNIIKKEQDNNYIKYNIFGIKVTLKKKKENKYKHSIHSRGFSDYIVDEFNRIVNENQYDFIVNNYIGESYLVENIINKQNTKTIYILHDLLFIQDYYMKGMDALEKSFVEEIRSIMHYDKIFCVSSDEALFIKRFINNKPIEYIPHILNEKKLENKEKNIDLLFIGSYNPYNVEALIWFFENVYKNLSNDINITICGSILNMDIVKETINKFINYKNINLVNFIEDLDDLYSKTKIAIVPMLRGTGLKIKTIEAMSRGIPVVGTILGVDGLEDKKESGCLVAENAEDFIYYINKLLEDRQFYNDIQSKIRYYFDKYLSLKTNEKKLNKIFDIENE